MLIKHTKPRQDMAIAMLVREIEAVGHELRRVTNKLDSREKERNLAALREDAK